MCGSGGRSGKKPNRKCSHVSIRNPACSIPASVSRARWPPPATRGQNVASANTSALEAPSAGGPRGRVGAVNAFVAAGAGFLVAVLWFDLMFDVQVVAHREGVLPEAVLASIAGYYARVTTAARPMNRLIATVMFATLAAIVAEIARKDPARWIGLASLGLAVPAITLAGARIVPRAVRLGTRRETAERQSALARSIFRGHVFCLAVMVGVLIVQLGFG
jgi:hypothetical protein